MLGRGVGDIVDAGIRHLVIDPSLVSRIGGEGVILVGIPLQMILLQIQDGSRVQGEGIRPVQLEAGKLHGEDVVVDLVGHRLQDGPTDVTDGAGSQPRRVENGLGHLGGRRLAIGASDGKPRDDAVRMHETPGQFWLSPDWNPLE